MTKPGLETGRAAGGLHPDAPAFRCINAGGIRKPGVVWPYAGARVEGFKSNGNGARPGFLNSQRLHLFPGEETRIVYLIQVGTQFAGRREQPCTEHEEIVMLAVI